jgi:hypothetical protein
VCWSAFPHCNKCPDTQLLKREGLLRSMVLEILIHDQAGLPLVVVTEGLMGRSRQNKTAHCRGRDGKEEGPGSHHPLKGQTLT